jgi:hypothetical protein
MNSSSNWAAHRGIARSIGAGSLRIRMRTRRGATKYIHRWTSLGPLAWRRRPSRHQTEYGNPLNTLTVKGNPRYCGRSEIVDRALEARSIQPKNGLYASQIQ